MSREEAFRLKAIFYSKHFINKFGDWLSVADKFIELPMELRTERKKRALMKKYNVNIELDKNCEPVLTNELKDFILIEYKRIYGEFKEN